MTEIDFPHALVRYNAPIVYLLFKEDAELDVPQVKELILAAETLTGKIPYLLFSDTRVNMNITNEARKIAAAKNEAPFVIANAVLIDNLALSIMANFFVKFNKPHFPLRVFYSEFKALEWLLKYAPEAISSSSIPDLSRTHNS